MKIEIGGTGNVIATKFETIDINDKQVTIGTIEDSSKLCPLNTNIGTRISRLPKAFRMSILASIQAFEKSSIENYLTLGEEWGVFVGMQTEYMNQGLYLMTDAYQNGSKYISPKQFPNSVLNSFSGWLSIAFKIEGPNITLCNGERSLSDALSMAIKYIEYGIISHALVVTSQTYTPFILDNITLTEIEYEEYSRAIVVKRK